MKKTIALVMAACMAGATLVGCGSSASSAAPAGDSSTSTAASSSDKQVTMDLIWWTDGNETKVMQGLIDEYEQLHPNIKINLQEIAFDDLNTKLQMSIAGGEAPAMSRGTEATVSQLHDAMVDFSDYIDTDALQSEYLESVDYLYKSGNEVVAIPTEVTANGMIYNKTAFEAAGVEVPTGPDDVWTWDEFREDLQKVVDSGAVKYGMVIDNPSHRWATILYEFGGSLANENGGNLSSPESMNAINFTKGLFDDGLAVSSIWLSGEDANNIFRSGQVAVHISGTWMIQNYDENIKDFEWGVTYMPKGTTRSSVPGGKNITAFKGTGCEQEAVDFITWVTAKEQNEKYCKDCLYVSPRKDNADIEYPVRAEAFSVFANELANTVPAAGFDMGMAGYTAIAYTDLQDYWPEVLAGTLTPEDMAAKIDADTNEFMADKGYIQ